MSRSLTRRDFLSTAGALLALSALPLRAHAGPLQQSEFSLDGKLHIIGLNTGPGIKPPGYAMPNSVLTSVDLATGKSNRTELPITDGHAALPLGEGRLACISHHGRTSCIVDAEHTVMRVLQTEENYLFGGHALVLPQRNAFVVPARHAYQHDAADRGRFLVYDLETLQELDQIEASALHPHEMRLIPGTDEIAVTHYGDINAPHPHYVHNVVTPALVIYDAATLKHKRTIAQTDYDAMLTHMDITPDGYAYCVMTQYYRVPPPDPSLSLDEQRSLARKLIENATGTADFAILDQGLREGRVSPPLPVLRINIRTGSVEPLIPDPDHQIRSQSVACNNITATAAATFFHADALFLHRPGDMATVLTGTTLGLNGIRGVADIPDTPFLAVTGSARDALILDTRSLDIVARLAVDNAHAPHVEYEKA